MSQKQRNKKHASDNTDNDSQSSVTESATTSESDSDSQDSTPRTQDKLSLKKKKIKKSRRPQWRRDAIRALVHAGSANKSVIKAKFTGVTGTRAQKTLAWERVTGR